jgi:hypothetical protein
MKKNKGFGLIAILLIIVAVLAIGGIAYYIGTKNSSIPQNTQGNNYQPITQNTTPSVPVQNNQVNNPVNNSTTTTTTTTQSTTSTNIPNGNVTWKTYTNSQYGFTFQYPDTWSLNGPEGNSENLSGAIMVHSIYFINSADNTHITVDYHLAPNGVELYQYALSQYQSSQGNYVANGKEIQVAGNIALEASNIWTKNGKGNPMPPTQSLVVDFLDKQQTGEFELQFTTPVAGDIQEVANFNQSLSTFQFTS